MSAKAEKKTKETKSGTLVVVSMQGKPAGEFSLDPFVFDGKINKTLMSQAIVTYLANQRMGLANTKTRGEVSGGGKKPWRQKGTGRARVGSSRSPLWRKGGVTFGPKPHSFAKDFPKRMKAVALKSALNAKLKENEIILVDQLTVSTNKTKDFVKILKNIKLNSSKIRMIVNAMDKNLFLAARNLANVELMDAKALSTYTALNCRQLVFTTAALKEVEERVKKCLA